MKRPNLIALLRLAVILLFAQTPPLEAAGTVTLTAATTPADSRTARYTFTWAANASGAVSGDTTTITFVSGTIARVELIPDSGGTQPTDLYDLTLLDEHGIDILAGAGANLSNSTGALVARPDIPVISGEAFQLVIANAGNAKGGTVKVWIER